jgi:hypothetical protein
MKKVICWMVSLLFVSAVWVACAPVQKTVVTKNTLPSLQGTWQGWTTFSSFQGYPVLTNLIIKNDTVPLEGTITLNNLPQGVAARFPASEVSAGNSAIIEFKNGHISDQGTLLGTSGQNFLELTYYAGTTSKFEGWFYYVGMRGTMSLSKK